MKAIVRDDIIKLRKQLSEKLLSLKDLKNEPRIVAQMVRAIPDAINGFSFSNGLRVNAGGVFVHQQPKVTCECFPETSVEIGDLLLLRKEGNQSRALLLQVKRRQSSCREIKPDNENQHKLYYSWPKFKYIRSTPELNDKTRHIKSKDIYMGAKYLLISDQHCQCQRCEKFCCHGDCCSCSLGYGMYTALPTMPHLSLFHCFIDELIQFFIGCAGKFYCQLHPNSSQTGWNKVISDLTDITANLFSKGTNGPRGHGIYRYRGSTSLSIPRFLDISHIPEIPDNLEMDSGFDDNTGGPSIIEFTIVS